MPQLVGSSTTLAPKVREIADLRREALDLELDELDESQEFDEYQANLHNDSCKTREIQRHAIQLTL